MKTKIFILTIALGLLIGIAACGDAPVAVQTAGQQSNEPVEAEPTQARPAITADREGNPITLPDEINTIISMGPATTEIVVALGFADKIIAIDEFSANVDGLPQGIPQFDMLTPDGEQMIVLNPDVIFVPGLSRYGGADDPFQVVTDVGICVIYIPSSVSIEGIKGDIRFLADVLDASDRAEAIIAQMEQEIDEIRSIGEAIATRRTVYFEVSPAPHMVSFGVGTFLDEMIGIIGATNVLAGIDGWSTVADEIILVANPDVILTSVNFLDDPVAEIMSRSGWDAISAIRNEAVFFIDTDASNRPSHNIVIAMREMAMAVYPEYFGG